MKKELTKELEKELRAELPGRDYSFDRSQNLVKDIKRFGELVKHTAQASPHSKKVIELWAIVQELNVEKLAKDLEIHLDTGNYPLVNLGLVQWKGKFSVIKRFIEQTNQEAELELVLFNGMIYTLDNYNKIYLKSIDKFALYQEPNDMKD